MKIFSIPSVIIKKIEAEWTWILKEDKRLSLIPSPAFEEKRKAIYVHKRLLKLKIKKAKIDKVGNVIAEIKGESPALVLDAHLDTVFPLSTPLFFKKIGNKIFGPATADNNLAIAVLLFLAKMLVDYPPDNKIILVFSVGEEAGGNSRGIKYFLKQQRQENIKAVISLEGLGVNEIVNQALGFRYLKICFKTNGGHAYKDFGKRISAISLLVKIVNRIDNLRIPKGATYNIGIVRGGTAVNSIASNAEMHLEIRSPIKNQLDDITKVIERIIKTHVSRGGSEDAHYIQKTIDDRPAGKYEGNVLQIVRKTYEEFGIKVQPGLQVTNCNVPIALGTPSLSLGITTGGYNHSLNEYFDLKPIKKSIKALFASIYSLSK